MSGAMNLKKKMRSSAIERMQAMAVIFLLGANLAQAEGPGAGLGPGPGTATGDAKQATAPAVQANAPQTTAAKQVPFDEMMRRSANPFNAYRGQIVGPPTLINSPRLNSFVREGKIYLSLRDAIDLALEDNLDLVISRYNLPIAQTDVLRTAAGGQARGVNTGVVSGTPGGAGAGSGAGSGAGGTSTGAGGAGAGTAGIVSSTLGTGTNVSGYDPVISANGYVDHTDQLLSNKQVEGVPVYKVNTIYGIVSYSQNFATGAAVQVSWVNGRQTTNGIYDILSPSLQSRVQAIVQQPLLAGFGFGPNLRFLHIARTNQKIGDIAFRAQIIATVTQICDIYWDLVEAYDTEQVGERSVGFAQETLDKSRKQLELQAIPEMDVLKAEGDLAERQQDLTVARTNLELQELYMKNAITRSLDDTALEEMPVVPTDHIGTTVQPDLTPVQQMIETALKNRTELQESALDLQNRELSRKSARNALLPTLNAYGLYAGSGLAGQLSPNNSVPGTTTDLPTAWTGAVESAFNNTAPEYQMGLSLNMPLRNRVAKADQYRTELEYRQAQVYAEELRKRIRIEVRNAHYALEQGASRIDAARKARDLAAKTLDIMQQEQKLGAGSNQQTLSSEHDLAVAESALVTAQTAYEKARIEVKRASGTILEDYGISIAEARAGVVEASHSN